ncbi:MAG: patatin-like phospholipase family protein [Betaproteobacteria bacterium]|nr:patatin-like phospholipase family protein [Betaproteobacteria bacterium]
MMLIIGRMKDRKLKPPKLVRSAKLQWRLWQRQRRRKARAKSQVAAPAAAKAATAAAPATHAPAAHAQAPAAHVPAQALAHAPVQALVHTPAHPASAPRAAEHGATALQLPGHQTHLPRTPRIALALQGGGSHGAFTWGVLHELLAQPDLNWQAVTGTSAGAVNAAVMTCGYAQGGREGAQQALEAFWRAISEAGENVSLSPRFLRSSAPQVWDWWTQALRQFSPYQFNPLNINPLRDVLAAHVDEAVLKSFDGWALSVCATQVRTGLPQLFAGQSLSLDAVLASACLPMVFQAVDIRGELYWDGGYTANPPLAPLIAPSDAPPFDHIVLVRINVAQRKEQPTSAADIMTRASEISFGAPLLAEGRMLDALTQLAERHGATKLLDALPTIEVIEGDAELRRFDADSKFDTDWAFLQELFKAGRRAAKRWLGQSEHVAAELKVPA